MPKSNWHNFETSLDFELSLTKRILTHKLSSFPVSFSDCASTLFSPIGDQTIPEKFVPPFPLNELSKILNSLTGKNFPDAKESKEALWDATLGACAITETTPLIEEEEEKHSIEIGSPRCSSGKTAFQPYAKNTECCDNNFQDLVTKESCQKGKEPKEPKYEKKNIYYKAVFRDIRRYYIEKLKSFSSSRLLKESIMELIKSEFKADQISDINEMVSILAPFLNYNKYMIEFEDKRVEDAKCILDCLQNFTLTKMRKVLQYSPIKHLVNNYYTRTVKNGSSDRFNSHKTMKKNPQKYLEVLKKL